MPAIDNLIRDFVLQDIKIAMDSFELTKAISHQGLKGKARELFVERLFRSLMSNEFKFGSGVITDRFGNQASETDVILYSPEILPARDAEETVGIFPIESCIYSIEVKSRITSTEIDDAIKKGQALDKLDAFYFVNRGPLSTRPITVLFAFSSDLKSGPEEEFKRFKERIDVAGIGSLGVPPIRVLCVVGKGYWYYGPATNDPTFGWRQTSASGQYQFAEVLSLASGILNTIRIEKPQRVGLPFGHYLLELGPIIDAK